MLARPTRRATYHRALGSGELIPQKERKLRRSEESGMLIGDRLGEGSIASSTHNELWRAENSFLKNERELRHSEGSGMLIGDPLGEGSTASSTDNELWRAENSFLRMRVYCSPRMCKCNLTVSQTPSIKYRRVRIHLSLCHFKMPLRCTL